MKTALLTGPYIRRRQVQEMSPLTHQRGVDGGESASEHPQPTCSPGATRAPPPSTLERGTRPGEQDRPPWGTKVLEQPLGRKRSSDAMRPNSCCHILARGDGRAIKDDVIFRKRDIRASEGNTFSRTVSIIIPR